MMTSLSDGLRDAGGSSFFWLGLALVLIIAIVGYVVSRKKIGSPKVGDTGKIVQDWIPTGRIDFAGPSLDVGAADTPTSFYLQAEEIRVLVSLSGIERKEIRWRRATLNEAKRVVNIFHRQMPKGRLAETASGDATSAGEDVAKDQG
jgi:hypothetical protein